MRLGFVSTALLISAFLAASCGSGSSSPAASTAPTSAATSAAQTVPNAISSTQAAAATPATNPTTRVNGTVASVNGNTVTLKEGGSFSLAPQTTITRNVAGSSTDLVPGKGVAVTAKQQPDNSLLASVIRVFPSAPGTLGQSPMDGGNLMTNATIDSGSGNAFTVTFPGGGAKVTVAPGAQIITRVAATTADIAVGATISASVLNGAAQSVSIG
jgi:hypothetical protein